MKLRFPFLFAALGAWLALAPAGALHAQTATTPDNTDKTDSVQASPAAEPVAPSTPASVPAPAPAPVPEPVPAPAPVAQPAPSAAPVWIDRGQVTIFGDNVTIREDERASEVTAYGGNVNVLGRVEGKVVAWGGNVKIEGHAGSVTAVGGNLSLGPKAEVAGAVALVGGHVNNPHRVPLRSNPLELAHHLPAPPDILSWLGDTLLHLRLLSPHVAWPWYVFGVCILFYLLLAAVFRRGVNACAESLEERPGTTLATALALLPLLPLFTLLLICTVIGIALLPFLAVALLFAAVFGKAAVLAFLGRSLLRASGFGESAGQAWLTVLIGAVLMAVLYCVPWLGLLLWALTGWIGLGMVVATILEKRRREKAAAAAVAQASRAAAQPVAAATPGSVAPAVAAAPLPASVSSAPVVTAAVAGPDLMDFPTTASAPAAAPAAAPAGAAVPPPPAPPLPPPLATPAAPATAEATLPRAEFGVRLAALLIDLVLVGAVGGVSMAFAILPFPLLFGCYVFAFWLWRGTTIGGIVFNLKVARLDGRPVDAATAAVRTLVAFLSVIPAGLGFLWCLWDDERQTWHDKVAGTVVVRVPKATPLV